MEEVIKSWAPGGAPKKEKNYEKKNLIHTSGR